MVICDLLPCSSEYTLPYILDDDLPADYNAAYETEGILGILAALESDHGTNFIDANKMFMALRKPFSEAQYDVVATYFHLQKGTNENPFEGWEGLNVAEVSLPTSVIEKLSFRAMESFASPGSILELGNEAATGLFLSGVSTISLREAALHEGIFRPFKPSSAFSGVLFETSRSRPSPGRISAAAEK